MDLLKRALSEAAQVLGFNLVPVEKKTQVCRLVMEITLQTNNATYLLNQFKRLNGTLLKQIVVVEVGTNFTKSPTNKDLASLDATQNGFLSLLDTSSNKIVDTIPLIDFTRDDSFEPRKGIFPDTPNIDWEQSLIEYADNTIPNANNGKSILLIVHFIPIKG